jgi:FkbM family methyltransferase
MNHIAAILPRRLKPWLWRKLSDYMHLDYRLPSGIRLKIASYSDWCIYNDIFIIGEYDEAIEAALQKASPTEVFHLVDLGANVGFFTLRVLDLINRRKISFPAISCLLVEASPRLEQAIRDHLQSAHLASLQTQVVIGLVGKRTGHARLELRASECMNQVVAAGRGHARTMAYYDLDQALTEVANIDLLKCDIEGSERDFLDNYPHLLRKTQAAIFEFHEPQCPASVGVPELMKAGFINNRVLYDQGQAQTVSFAR